MLPKTDLPLHRDATGRLLPWLIAFMVYVAVLALAGAVLAHKTAVKWDQGLSGRLTIQVLPAEPGATPMAERLELVLDILAGTPGVNQAEILAADEIDRLLAPWLDNVSDQDLPLPAMIAVSLDSRYTVDLAGLSDQLTAEVPGAIVDDHQIWLEGMLTLTRTVEWLALGIVTLVVGAAIVTVVLVTRAGLSIHAQVVELLHLIGAHDGYVAQQFQWQALKIALFGSLGGLLPALVTVLLLGHFVHQADAGLLQDLNLGISGWALILTPPFATALVATLTARLTVLRSLAAMP